MYVKLTATEKKVVELYSKGLRPREIAQALGISINTVYKALSKARKAYSLTEEVHASAFPPSISLSVNVYLYPSTSFQPAAVSSSSAVAIYNAYDAIMRKLEKILSYLEQWQETLRRWPMRDEPRPQREAMREEFRAQREEVRLGGDGHMPELLRRNVWISIIRNKAT